jgi:hypothetical protein
MTDIDFIEIGTSNFDTLIEGATEKTIGFSIDPIQSYLDDLPYKPNVKTCCIAISGKCEPNQKIDVFYIPKKIIAYKNLPDWFKGCNTIGNYHLQHIKWGLTDVVEKLSVPVVSLGTFYDVHQIRGCNFLKIDTEGHDIVILDEFVNYLKQKGNLYYPKKIKFESNELSDPEKVKEIIGKYIMLGYSLESSGYDTILIL